MYQKFSLFSLPKILDGQNCFKRMIKLSQFLKDTFLKGFDIHQMRFQFDELIIKLWQSLSSSIWRVPNPIFSFLPPKNEILKRKGKAYSSPPPATHITPICPHVVSEANVIASQFERRLRARGSQVLEHSSLSKVFETRICAAPRPIDLWSLIVFKYLKSHQ